jgi:hypothetical protein
MAWADFFRFLAVAMIALACSQAEAADAAAFARVVFPLVSFEQVIRTPTSPEAVKFAAKLYEELLVALVASEGEILSIGLRGNSSRVEATLGCTGASVAQAISLAGEAGVCVRLAQLAYCSGSLGLAVNGLDPTTEPSTPVAATTLATTTTEPSTTTLAGTTTEPEPSSTFSFTTRTPGGGTATSLLAPLGLGEWALLAILFGIGFILVVVILVLVRSLRQQQRAKADRRFMRKLMSMAAFGDLPPPVVHDLL